MAATLLAMASVVVASALIGQLICAASGSAAWAPSAPAVGLGALLGVAAPGLSLPGRTTGPLLIIVGLSVAGAGLLWRRPDHRPPVAVVVPVLLASAAVLVPFIAARRFGTLGVSIDDDMAGHLMLAGAFNSAAIAHVAPSLNLSTYPLGPHGVAATVASAWGRGLAESFTGFTIALAPLISLTAWGQLCTLRRLVAQLAAFIVGTAYLVVAYVGEGAFKEPAMIVLLFGMVWELEQLRSSSRVGLTRLLPIAVIGVGLLSVYTVEGLWWPTVVLPAVAVATLWQRRRAGRQTGWSDVRAVLAPSVLGAAAFALMIAPQLPRIYRFYHAIVGVIVPVGTATDAIPVGSLGNLVRPLSPVEATGSWLSASFKYAPPDLALSEVGGLIIFVFALIGFVRLLQRGRLELPLAAACCGAIWSYAALSQSAYVAAKALVIWSPFVLCLAAIGLFDFSAGVAWTARARGVLGGCLSLIVGLCSYLALTGSAVGPSSHARSMATFRPIVSGRNTLVFESDVFVDSYLAGARVTAPGLTPLPASPGRAWKPHARFGWDSVTATALQRYEYVVAPIDPASGEPPPNFDMVRISGPYALFKRRSRSSETPSIGERTRSGSPDCRETDTHQLRWIGYEADARSPPIHLPVRDTDEGASSTVRTPELEAGRYYVNLRYIAYEPVRITATGLSVTVPATLEGLGTYWPVGQIVVSRRRSLTVRLAEGPGRLNSPNFGLTHKVVLQLTKLLSNNHSTCGRTPTNRTNR